MLQAGCIPKKDSRQLIIALEPEAASLFCRRLHLARFEQDDDKISFKKGTKYLILDCGGMYNKVIKQVTPKYIEDISKRHISVKISQVSQTYDNLKPYIIL